MTEEQLEKKIIKTYNTAAKEMEKNFTQYMEQFAQKDAHKRVLLQAGEITEAEYNYWRLGQVATGERWQAMRNILSNEVLAANNTANLLINGNLPNFFAEGINYGTFEVETLFDVNTVFTLYDKNLALNLIEKHPKLLPQLKPPSPTAIAIQEGRIKRWSAQKITAQVTQGILQGDSIPKLAARLRKVTDMSKNASIRNARTANTSARNSGHDAAYARAVEQGIDVQRMWIAALDDRTRHEHRLLDMQVRKVGEPFEVDGYTIMYPADPSAEPEMVYNCRCRVIAYNPAMNITLEDRNTSKLEQDYEEWKGEHQTAQTEEQALQQIAEEQPLKEEPHKEAPDFNEWQQMMIEKSDKSDTAFNREMFELENKSLSVLTDEQKTGLKIYTGSSYDDMNTYLRNGETGRISDSTLEALNNARDGLNSTTLGEDMILRRGTDYGDIAGAFMTGNFEENKDYIRELLLNDKLNEVNAMFEGAVGNFAGFTSTSSHYDRGFRGQLEILFFAPAETHASSIMSISRFGTGEGETLLAPNTTVKWLGLEKSRDRHKNSDYRLFLEIIP